MSSFCSLLFLGIFVPVTFALYRLFPRENRPWVLLVASYLCFWLISGKLIAALALTTLVTFFAGRILAQQLVRQKNEIAQNRSERKAIKRRWQRKMRLTIALASLGSLGVLVAVKYLSFLFGIGNSLFELAGAGKPLVPPAIGIPIGISFYTLQALSYLFDVYRKTIPAERHLGRFALYMSFFPQLMEGPICRYSQVSEQLMRGDAPSAEQIGSGVLRIAWGAAKIILVADRLNLFVKPVFDSPFSWNGTVVAVGAVFYTLQLYCDFSGTMDIVLGCGRLFGVTLPENFRQPFFSRTASEFWQRWHITLGAWLRDYVFYPVSLSAPVKKASSIARRRLGNRLGSALAGGIALWCVWTINGLWHGAGWQYLFFGMYYFVLILGANIAEPLFARLRAALHIPATSRAWSAFQIGRTVCIVCIGELIFRAPGFRAGIAMLHSLFTSFNVAQLTDGTLMLPGMDGADFVVIGIFAAVLFAVDFARERHLHPLDALQPSQRMLFYSLGCSVLVICIAIFGAYGFGYIPLDPIYAQF